MPKHRAVAITTIDNEFDPIDECDEWLRRDNELGYGTSQYLARVALTSDQFSDSENTRRKEEAIDRIIALDPFFMYKKVVKEIDD